MYSTYDNSEYPDKLRSAKIGSLQPEHMVIDVRQSTFQILLWRFMKVNNLGVTTNE